MSNRRRQGGFTLLELLVVVAIIGLLASVLIPNLVDALHKARQKRTLTDMRGLGTAWMGWLTDQTGAASAGAAKTYNTNGMANVPYADLVLYLHPTDTFFYATDVPQNDAWGFRFRFSKGGTTGNRDRLLICARGRDGVFNACSQRLIPVEPFLTTDYDRDIVWADGYFVRWPEGLSVK